MTEPAYHARGAGRETIQRTLEASLERANDCVAKAEAQQRRMPFDHDNNDALVGHKKWKADLEAALREPGADTGTTPPEGLDAGVRAALECAEYALTHPGSNQHFALTAVRHVMAELDAAATQRAPVEQGREPNFGIESSAEDKAEIYAHNRKPELLPCPFCGSTDLKLTNLTEVDDFYVSCNKCEVQQIANYTEGKAVQHWNLRAPDHAREGARASALKDACAAICNGCAQGHPIVSDPMDEEHEELHDWGFTKQPCAAWKIRKLLEEALADGKEK